jgi:hypothetical protein
VFARTVVERALSPDQAMFAGVVDDHGQRYRLKMNSSAASSSGAKRVRWDLRLDLSPAPGPAVKWLRFTTPHGQVTAHLRPPAETAVTTETDTLAMDTAEFYLHRQLHNHAWLHLLDPERPLARLSVIADALVAVGAVNSDHSLVTAVNSVDDAIAGQATIGLPEVVASALRPQADRQPWIGTTALAVAASHPDGGKLGLEALVGHPDRLALHFIQPGWQQGRSGAWNLVVSATDDQGRGHVSGTEPLSSPGEGAFHLRPPLAADASRLTVRLHGPTTSMEIEIHLTRADSHGS